MLKWIITELSAEKYVHIKDLKSLKKIIFYFGVQMICFLLVVYFVTFAYGNLFQINSQSILHLLKIEKIIGGNAEISEAPYQIAMIYTKPEGYFYQACSGSIINPKIIVSVAHCPHKTSPADWKIRAGSAQSDSGGQLLNVTQIIIHPNYNENTIDYDISLYILASYIKIDGVNTAIIPLPAQDAHVEDNTIASVTGWGSISEGGRTVRNLRKIKIPIVNQKICTDAYSGSTIVTPRMICAGIMKTGGRDACHGDSGGPLVIDGVLIGITSWGKGCARVGFPGVWTRVPAFKNWIDGYVSRIETLK